MSDDTGKHLPDDDGGLRGDLRRVPRTRDAVAVALAEGGRPGGPPHVVAGGRGRIAEQILQVAFAQGIKVREDADLAELLSTIETEEEIPVEAFAAVAEILIYLYRANGSPDTANLSADEVVRRWMGEVQQ